MMSGNFDITVTFPEEHWRFQRRRVLAPLLPLGQSQQFPFEVLEIDGRRGLFELQQILRPRLRADKPARANIGADAGLQAEQS